LSDDNRGISPPEFDEHFIQRLDDLMVWRRDVRHFKTDPLAPGMLDDILDRAYLAPSVGNSQPWRFVKINSPALRTQIIEDFMECNDAALHDYAGETAKLYASLKLAGLQDAPEHLAVFVNTAPEEGLGLGRKTMPEMLHYSTVTALMQMWLYARARHVGIGWVSILNPERVKTIVDVPPHWDFISYLCIGYPQQETNIPTLEKVGWQARVNREKFTQER
tara:strand:- start:376 stop:1035 length:660 start_codon:yes stop_codon:yes gene_type:complete